MTVEVTTVKVSKRVRDRLARAAHEEGLSASGMIEALLEEHARGRRFAAFGRAMITVDLEYQVETEIWDRTLLDGLGNG